VLCRLFAQVDFRREMRPIAFVDPAALPVTNPDRSPTKQTSGPRRQETVPTHTFKGICESEISLWSAGIASPASFNLSAHAKTILYRTTKPPNFRLAYALFPPRFGGRSTTIAWTRRTVPVGNASVLSQQVIIDAEFRNQRIRSSRDNQPRLPGPRSACLGW